jgi:N-methylhydantoinase B/oxoprolinase/acetone carboxylase alpha subunit
MTPGGGGFGNPRERTMKALLNDYRSGRFSAEKIQADYGIDIRKVEREPSVGQ